mgnify:CR=1 FL=1
MKLENNDIDIVGINQAIKKEKEMKLKKMELDYDQSDIETE